MVSLHATLTAEAVLDKGSGIVNDPNGWFDDPEDLIAAIRRIMHVSLETARIVKGLTEPFRLAEGWQMSGEGLREPAPTGLCKGGGFRDRFTTFVSDNDRFPHGLLDEPA